MTKKEKADALAKLNALAEESPAEVIACVRACPEVFQVIGLVFEFDKWPNPTRVEFKWQ